MKSNRSMEFQTSEDQIIMIVYNYARKLCADTLLDYRDVAHMVLIKHLEDLRNGKIRYIKTYLYVAIYYATMDMLKQENRYILSSVDCLRYDRHDHCLELDSFLKYLNNKEYFLIHCFLKGYSRKEMATLLNMTTPGINTIWFRMIKKLKNKIIRRRM